MMIKKLTFALFIAAVFGGIYWYYFASTKPYQPTSHELRRDLTSEVSLFLPQQSNSSSSAHLLLFGSDYQRGLAEYSLLLGEQTQNKFETRIRYKMESLNSNDHFYLLDFYYQLEGLSGRWQSNKTSQSWGRYLATQGAMYKKALQLDRNAWLYPQGSYSLYVEWSRKNSDSASDVLKWSFPDRGLKTLTSGYAGQAASRWFVSEAGMFYVLNKGTRSIDDETVRKDVENHFSCSSALKFVASRAKAIKQAQQLWRRVLGNKESACPLQLTVISSSGETWVSQDPDASMIRFPITRPLNLKDVLLKEEKSDRADEFENFFLRHKSLIAVRSYIALKRFLKSQNLRNGTLLFWDPVSLILWYSDGEVHKNVVRGIDVLASFEARTPIWLNYTL